MFVMKRTLALAVAAVTLVATPLFAAPPTKRPLCQITKACDAKRAEPCRKNEIPPVIDLTPLFLASTNASPAVLSDLS